MLQSSHLNEAQSALETYVSQAGAEGAHYQESLQLITSIEKTRRQNAVAPQAAGESEPVAVIEPAGEGRVESLRKLYLADSDREALTLHINSLLECMKLKSEITAAVKGEVVDCSGVRGTVFCRRGY